MSQEQVAEGMQDKPVTTGEILMYGCGTLCNGPVNSTHGLLTSLMVLILGMNPILAGLILSIRTLWNGIITPVMASITDNASTRWGRRRPFIFTGGILTVILCVCIWTFIPVGDDVKPNARKTAAAEPPAASSAAAETAAEPVPAAEKAVQASPAPAETAVAAEAAKTAPKPIVKPSKKSFRETIREGARTLQGTSADHRRIFFYLTVMLLILATTHTVFSVPYGALGIELSPTYHGRTRVVAYRAAFNKVIGLITPWYLPFCMLAVFPNAIAGMKWLIVLLACLALPGVLVSSLLTRERTHVDKARKKVNLFSSIAVTLKNIHFLKLALLYIGLQLTQGLFMQFGLYVNIFYVFGGDQGTAMKFGALMGAKVGTLGAILAICTLPAVTWMCRRFQKQNALRAALLLTGLGNFLGWFMYNPRNPNLQFILPFFSSLGISSTYIVLNTMMADVTDVDELNTGTRREAMFGAVLGWMMNGVGTIQPLAASAILLSTGFNPQAMSQTLPETVFKMRLFATLAPAACMVLISLLLWRYPLTRDRMAEIKEQIAQRKAAAAGAS